MAEYTLKLGWHHLHLSDVCDEISERVNNPSESEFERFVGLEHMESGETNLRKFGSTADLVSAMKRFKAGDILVARRNIYLKRAALADFDGVCSGDAIVLRPKNNGQIAEGLLQFVLNTDDFWEYATRHAAGTMSKRLSVEKLLGYTFTLPPIEDQKRAYSLLTTISDVAEALRVAIYSLPNVRRALELDLLTSTAFERRKVGEIAKFSSGKGIRVSDLPKIKSEENPIPVFGGNGISGYTNTAMTGTDLPTVVIGRVGQFCGVTSMTSGSCWITDNALYPVTKDENIRSEFLAICLRASNLNRSKLGEYLPLITQEVVHKVEIPVPPLDQQDLLISRFAEIESGIDNLEARTTRIRSLAKNVLNGLCV